MDFIDAILCVVFPRLITVVIPFLLCYFGCRIYLNICKKKDIKRAVREETGERHAAKSHIPDMGGIVFLAVVMIYFIFPITITVIGSLISFNFDFRNLLNLYSYYAISSGWFFPILLGLIGLSDDIAKHYLKDTKGIPARYRIALQALVVILFLYCTYHQHAGIFTFPGDTPRPEFLGFIFILATINAANFTDGLDGLLPGVSLISAFGFLIFFEFWSAQRPDIFMSPILYGHGLFFFVSIMLAFLIFNRHPAKMFMGDGGSMFIGGFLACYAFEHGLMLLLLIMAFPMYFELISVVIQVVSFKLTGRRVFPMAPIHHSFEKWGWSEPKIVWFFYIITFITMLIGVWVAIGFGSKYALLAL